MVFVGYLEYPGYSKVFHMGIPWYSKGIQKVFRVNPR